MNRQDYIKMLAGRGLAIGDQVVCQYRVPTPHQYWIHPFWVGVIQDVTEDKAQWNGHKTQADFCATYLYVPVRYLDADGMRGFDQLDSLAHLRQLHFGNVEKSPWFTDGTSAGEGYRSADLYRFACKCGMSELYREHRRAMLELVA